MAEGPVVRNAPMRATMKDVAALAGVSLKTVSRVINGEGAVNDDMANRVREAVATLRYQPNYSASALRRSDGRSSQIAVLLEDLSNPFSGAIYRAVEEIAMVRGFTVLGGSLDEDPERERSVVDAMVRHRVDGFIIAPSSQDHTYLRAEQTAGMPLVFVDRPPVGLAADCVLSDSRAGAAQAVQHLMRHGHRRIAYLGDLEWIYTAQQRRLGYRDAIGEMDEQLVVSGLRSAAEVETAVAHLLALANPPSAFFTGQNLITMGAVRHLRARGLHHTVALIGFDDFVLADLLEPAVSVIAQDPAAIGARAARLLFDRLAGLDQALVNEIVPLQLRARGSGEIPVTG